MLAQIEENEETCNALVKKMKSVMEYQETLDMKINHFDDINTAQQAHKIRKLLWQSLKEWTELVAAWEDVVFDEIDVEEITTLSNDYFLKVTKCENRLPGSSAVAKLSKLVRDFKSTMPIVTALGNKKLLDIHWDEINEILDIPDTEDFCLKDKQFKLGELIELNVGDKEEEVVHISTTATQEHQLKNELAQLIETWNNMDFCVEKPDGYNYYLIRKWDIIINILDESLTIISDIQGSRYVKRLQDQVQKEQNQLITIANTIDEWKNCQKQWLYLYNIFEACKEIKDKCSKEWQTFSSVNKQWEALMKKVSKKYLVKQHCTEKVCNELKQNNLKMDEV